MINKNNPRKNDGLKIGYALKDSSAQLLDLEGATLTVTMEYPDLTKTTADDVTLIDNPTEYNVEVTFNYPKMNKVGWHRVQVEVAFSDGTLRHSEIDRFYVADNLD